MHSTIVILLSAAYKE